MFRVIKYASLRDDGARCGEKSADCESDARMHVCFEEGDGMYLCKKCFQGRVNRGDWIVDSTVVLN